MQPSQDEWRIVVSNKLEEFRAMWQQIYLEERETGVGVSKLQRATRIIAQQLTVLLSASIDGRDSKDLDALAATVKLLHELSEFKLRFGDDPLKDFNEIGDNVIISINKLMKSANAPQAAEESPN